MFRWLNIHRYFQNMTIFTIATDHNILDRNRNNDNPFLTNNSTANFHSNHFACSPVWPQSGYTRRIFVNYHKLQGEWWTNFCCFLGSYSPYCCWYFRNVISGIIVFSQIRFLHQMSITCLFFLISFRRFSKKQGCRGPRQNVRAFMQRIIPHR